MLYDNSYHQYTPNVGIYTSTMDPMGCRFSTISNWWFIGFRWPIHSMLPSRPGESVSSPFSRLTITGGIPVYTIQVINVS